MALRILLVCPGMHPRDGGPPRVVSGSAAALAHAGCAVEIVTMGDPHDDAETRAAWPELPGSGVALHIFPREPPRQLGRSAALIEFVRANAGRFDLLHIHCVWENALADAAAVFRRAGKPVLVSPHGMLDRWQLRQSAFKKRVARLFFGTGAMLSRADAVLYGTQEEADEAAHLQLGRRVVLMPNGAAPLEIADPQAARQALRTRFPQLREWSRTVLFFSRLHPKKGLDMLVEAFGRVHREFPGAGLFAAAIEQDREYEARVREQIAALGDAPIVLTTELSGPDAKSVFTVSDIFCLPSHQEGFSIAIIEAASAGLPELITDTCHMQEIAEEGAGVVVPASADGLERGLRQMLSLDTQALGEMGRRARDLIAARYTWQSVAQRLIVAYGDAIEAKRS